MYKRQGIGRHHFLREDVEESGQYHQVDVQALEPLHDGAGHLPIAREILPGHYIACLLYTS